MASSVATVLERQFTTIAGLDSMTSSSGTGKPVHAAIHPGPRYRRRGGGCAERDRGSHAAVAAGQAAPPSFNKKNPSDQPIIYLTLTSDAADVDHLDEFAETQMAPRIAMINGVSQVQVQGQQKYAVRVQIDPDKLAAKGVGLDQVDAALNQWNINPPLGILYGPRIEYNFTPTAS